VFPPNVSAQVAQSAESPTRSQPEDTKRCRANATFLLGEWLRNSFCEPQTLECFSSMSSAMGKHAPNHSLEHFAWRTEVKWSSLGLRQMSFLHEVLQSVFVSHEALRNVYVFASHNTNVLPTKQLFCANCSQTSHEMPFPINPGSRYSHCCRMDIVLALLILLQDVQQNQNMYVSHKLHNFSLVDSNY
jgi:hypothetical protein